MRLLESINLKNLSIFVKLIFWKLLLIGVFFLALFGCANRHLECIKDGKKYCVTNEKIFSEAWYSCYLRGISCMEGECWENAEGEFIRAIKNRKRDERWVRTYGMHRLPEYFPKRELGVVYYNLAHTYYQYEYLDDALEYLSLSLKECESAKAKFYIDMARKEMLILNQMDREIPELFLDNYIHITKEPSITISGMTSDDTFVGQIEIRVNKRKPLSLLDVSQPISHRFKKK